LKANGLTPRVVVIDNKEYAQISKNSNSLESSDVLATIGNVNESQKAQTNLEKGGYDKVYPQANTLDESSNIGGIRFEADGSYAEATDKGNRIAIVREAVSDASAYYGMSFEGLASKTLQHGTTHNAGIGHNDKAGDNNRPTTTGNNFKPDITTSGEYYQNHPSQIIKGMATYGEKLKALFKSTGKFTSNEAKDKVFDKEVKYEKK
jgi:hypothetical protein